MQADPWTVLVPLESLVPVSVVVPATAFTDNVPAGTPLQAGFCASMSDANVMLPVWLRLTIAVPSPPMIVPEAIVPATPPVPTFSVATPANMPRRRCAGEPGDVVCTSSTPPSVRFDVPSPMAVATMSGPFEVMVPPRMFSDPSTYKFPAGLMVSPPPERLNVPGPDVP